MSRPRTRLIRFLLPVGLSICSIVMLSASLTKPTDPVGPRAGGSSTDRGLSQRYRQFCASCHGTDGQGFGSSAYDERTGEFVGDLHDHRPANLTCPGVSLDLEALAQIVRGGISCRTHGQVMPAFPDLTDEQFSEIAAQLRAFAKDHLGHEHDEGK